MIFFYLYKSDNKYLIIFKINIEIIFWYIEVYKNKEIISFCFYNFLERG